MKFLAFQSLRFRLASLILSTMMLASGLMFCNYLIERRNILSHVSEDFIQLVTLIARDQEELIGRTRQFLITLSRASELDPIESGPCSRFLTQLIHEYSRYQNLAVLDTEGVLVCSALPFASPAVFSQEPWFKHSTRRRDFAMDSLRMGSGAEAGVVISYPLLDHSGGVRGLIFAAVDLALFSRPIAHLQPARQFDFFMLDQSGALVSCYSTHDHCRGKSLQEAPLLKAIHDRGTGAVAMKDSNRLDRLYAFAPLSSQVDTGLFVVVGTPTDTLYRNADRMILYQFAGLWLIAVLALCAVWFGSSALIIKPVSAMVHTSEQLSRGAMAARTGLPHRSGELGSLARALDTMAESLEDRARQVQEYETQLRSLAAQLSGAEERERRRLAADLHDRLGQLLGISKIKLGMLRQIHPASESPELIDQIRGYINQAILETRSLTFEISPPILYELGLEAALEYLAEHVQRIHGLKVSYTDDRFPKPLDHDLRAFLFRAAGELLQNVVKHAKAHHATMSTHLDGEHIVLGVEDDGVGFEPRASNPSGVRTDGFGLFSIRERLHHMGGELILASNPGQGTKLMLKAPLKRAASRENDESP